MALLDGLAGLDSAHRQEQLKLAVAVGGRVAQLYSGLTARDILAVQSDRVDDWIGRSSTLIGAAYERSREYGADYFEGVRDLVTNAGRDIDHADVDPISLERIQTSLFVTGIASARNRLSEPGTAIDREDPLRQRQADLLSAGRDQQALELSMNEAVGATTKLVGEGGRDQVKADVERDRVAIGWIRITSASANTCFFCAMLASRGPVYQGDSFDESDARFEGPGRHKVHDNCSCSLRPVFTRSSAEIPQWNFDQIDAWRDLSKNLGRSPNIRDWRADYASRTKVA